MTNNSRDGKLPGQLAQIHERFVELTGAVQKEIFTDLEKILKKIYDDYQKELGHLGSGTGKQDKGTAYHESDSIEKFLNGVNHLLEENKNSLPEGIFNKLTEQVLAGFRTAAGSEVQTYRSELDLSFWRHAPADNFLQRNTRNIEYIKLRVKKIFLGKKSQKEGFFGRQVFDPGEVYLFLFVIPLIWKMIDLTGAYLQSLGRSFHELHNSNESLIKKIINEEKNRISDPGSLPEAIKQISGEASPISGYVGENLPKELLSELSDFQQQLLEELTEKTTIAGTKLYPTAKFSYSRSDEKLAEIGSEAKKFSGSWRKYFNREADDWIKDVQVLKLVHSGYRVCIEAREQMNSRVRENFLPVVREAAGTIRSSIQLFSEQTSIDKEGLKESILKESRLTFRELRRDKLPLITDRIHQSAIPKIISNILSRIKHKIGSLEDEYSIFRQLDLDKIPPEVKTQQISLVKIIKTEYLSVFSEQYSELSAEVGKFLDQRLRTLNEINQIIEFNIETALEILDSSGSGDNYPDARLVVEEGLNRAYEVIEETGHKLEKAPDEWWDKMKDLFIEFNDGIYDLSDNEKILNLQIREARAEFSTRIKSLRGRGLEHARGYLRKLWSWFSYVIKGARTGYRRIGRLTGHLTLPEKEKEFMDLLYSTGNRIKKLPYVYQRLYRYEPLDDHTLFGGRQMEIDELVEIFRRWKEGSFSNTAIIGEKGSGRTTLINLASKQVGKSNTVYRININKNIDTEEALTGLFSKMTGSKLPGSLEELKNALLKLENPVICVVEDLQFLFLRTLDGFDLVEKFLWLISLTHKKVFWMVSIGSYSWNFLDVVLSINRYFHHYIFLSQLEVEQVSDIILRRHRISGYGLEFVPSETDLNDRRYKRLRTEEERQEFLIKNFFEELHSITRGNISVAMLLWQLSVEEFGKDKIIVRNNLRYETNFLNDLPEEELFTLEAILEHEYLTVEEHSVIFCEPEEISMHVLSRMRNKGLLVETSAGFQVHYLIYKPVVRTLNSKNILK